MQHKRIALVTGGNQGVGLQVAKELAANASLRAPGNLGRGSARC
jgi:NAD(P)-dependent dehydrogenase (short-subunit alcohol dehydrogenase family)